MPGTDNTWLRTITASVNKIYIKKFYYRTLLTTTDVHEISLQRVLGTDNTANRPLYSIILIPLL